VSRRFEERSIRKLYLAVVEGGPGEPSGVIESPLGPDPSSRVEMKVSVSPGGLAARTHWRLVRPLGDYSLLELEPKSGRRHQLRVHLASIGHPIVGDKLYGAGDEVFLRSLSDEGLTSADRSRLSLGRQALHAWRLEFDLDGLSFGYRFEAPLASDIAGWIGELENSGMARPAVALGA
jgi:23S rRNA-/tRNA-specific pseudouridylate synthase